MTYVERGEPNEAYLQDPKFHCVVDAMLSLLVGNKFTPHEIRQAAIYACLRYEQQIRSEK